MQIQAIDPVGPTRLAIELTRPLAEKRGIQLLINLSQGTHEILADATRVQQIVWNLLSNAVKFSPKGSVIQVDLKYVKELGREYAELKVTDEGKGIPPDFLPRIFNRFSQADNASTRQFGGLGLGLSIAQNLVELQGGTLRAENRLRESGAIFTVLFPLISERSRAIVQSKESETAVPSDSLRAAVRLDELPNLSGVRVLIVDDDESTLDAIAIFIKSFGADVLAVQSGEAAIKGLSTFIADVLVSDIAMPGEDGYSLIRRIRKSEKESNTYLPAIALTAFASPRDIENALQAGFQCHLPKPVEANDLGRKIQGLARSPSNTST